MAKGNICRIDKEEGPFPAANAQKGKIVAWPLSKRQPFGPLIYATLDRNDFAPFFEKHGEVKVWVEEGAPDLNIYVGRYRGKSEVYDSSDLLHLRQAMGYNNLTEKVLKGKLKVGFQGSRVSLGNGILAVKEAAEWVNPATLGPVGKLAEKAITGRPKYFIGFSNEVDAAHIVHMQEKIFAALINHKDHGRKITLGEVWSSYGTQIHAFLGQL